MHAVSLSQVVDIIHFNDNGIIRYRQQNHQLNNSRYPNPNI